MAVNSTPSKKKSTLVAVVALTAVTAFALYVYSNRPAENQHPVAGQIGDASGVGQTEPKVDGVVDLPSDDLSASSAATGLLTSYQCAQGQQCAGSPYVASTEIEARWLQRHGYPTQQQFEQARSLSADQLKTRAAQGSLADQALYAEKMAEEGKTRAAIGLLGKTIASGSTYGLYSLSTVYGSKSSILYDPKLSRAYLRLAYLAGDSKAIFALGNRFPEFDTPTENLIVDQRASELHRSLLRGRSAPRP